MKYFQSRQGQSDDKQADITQLGSMTSEEFQRFTEWLYKLFEQVKTPIVFGFNIQGNNAVFNGTNLIDTSVTPAVPTVQLVIVGQANPFIGQVSYIDNNLRKPQTIVFDLSSLPSGRYEFTLGNFSYSLIK